MIHDYFNEKADTWDSYASERDAGKLERMVKRLGLKSSMTVLDVGTGTGVFLPYLLKIIGMSGKIIALDVADKMLLQALKKGIKGKISYLCADVESIPLQADMCDAVVCYSSFPHFRDKLRALQEIKRVLKKGGLITICHTSSREAINQIHSSVPLLYHDLLPAENDMKVLLKKASFTGIVVEDKAESYLAMAKKTN